MLIERNGRKCGKKDTKIVQKINKSDNVTRSVTGED